MIPPKAVTDQKKELTEKLKEIESRKPFSFPTREMPDEEKAVWDAWVDDWNRECLREGLTAILCIKSDQAII